MPAIISRELFDAAQAQLDRNKRLAQRNANGERYLVRGLTVCACCGYAFSGRSSKSHTYSYCQGRFAHRFGGQRVCGNPTISGEQLDDYVWRSVSALLKDPARMLEEWSRRQKSGGVTAELQQHRDDAARAVAAFERTMKRLVDAYEVGAIEVEDLKQRSDTVRARSERAQRELADAETRLGETVQLRAIVAQLDDFAARVRARLDALSWLERRTIIRTLVAKIDIDEKGATIVYRLPSAERTPPPSGANPPGEGTSDQHNRTSCLLRKQRGGLVTANGLASPLDARIALALTHRSDLISARY